MSKFIRVLAAAVAVTALSAHGAQASFHFMHITEVMSGFGAGQNIQYLELEMQAAGQTQVSNSRLTAFSADGSVASVLLATPANVANGQSGRNVLYGTAEFAAAAGVTPDFTFAAGIVSPSGMVCWGAPGALPPSDPNTWDEAIPNNYVDCIAYGGYTGATATNSGMPSALPPGDGNQALVRTGDTGNNAADFSLSIPAPCNNAGDCGSLTGAPTTTMPPTTTTSVSVTTSSTTSSTSLSLPTGSTSTTMAIPICGNADNNDAITATDALVSLVAAVGAAFCADCFCDVNSAGGVTATDSLLILQSAVGQPVTLVCPPCTF